MEARVEWVEPWPSCGPEGDVISGHVTISCTVHDAINMQRSAAKQLGQPTMGRDAEHLADFIAVHGAKVEDVEADEESDGEQSVAPLVISIIALLLATIWIINLRIDNMQLILGAPSAYRLEHFGYNLLGSCFRATTDGWTSNVGSKASAIRQAWKHWDAKDKPEWQEAK